MMTGKKSSAQQDVCMHIIVCVCVCECALCNTNYMQNIVSSLGLMNAMGAYEVDWSKSRVGWGKLLL